MKTEFPHNMPIQIMVLGAGTMGYGLALLAAKSGHRVFLVDVKQAVLKSGADHVIDLTKEDLKNSLRDQVYAITDGRGADVILDPLGDHIFDASLRALAWCGRIVVIGFVAGGVPEIKANYLLIKNITVSGLFFNTYRERETKWTRRVQNEILDYLVAGKVISPVMKTLPLEDFKEALSMIVARQVQGRVILTTR